MSLDQALRSGASDQVADLRLEMSVRFRDCAAGTARWAHVCRHRIDDAVLAAARAVFEKHCRSAAPPFARSMHFAPPAPA